MAMNCDTTDVIGQMTVATWQM